MPGIYPGRTFSGSKNPHQWFGNVNPMEVPWGEDLKNIDPSKENPVRSARVQKALSPAYPGLFEGLEEPPAAPGPRFGGAGGLGNAMRSSMAALENTVGQDPNSLRDNMATGEKVVRARRAKMMDDYWKKPRASIGGPDFGPSYGTGASMEGTPWGDFFTALVGKEANTEAAGGKMRVGWGGFGRTKAYDPAIAQMYDLESGEMPPQEYSPEQMNYISRSQPALNALRRAAGLPGVLV